MPIPINFRKIGPSGRSKSSNVMGYNPEKHNRRSIRLRGYDYSSPGLYFVTICTHNRVCLFGEINDGKMILNRWGTIARTEWQKTESIRDNVTLDAFVIMPNHLHGIVQIVDFNNHVGAYRDTPLRNTSAQNNNDKQPSEFRSPSKTLGAIIRGYKSAVTTRMNKKRNTSGQPVWQRNYHDHIIRDEASLKRIRYYIIQNPSRWDEDRNNPRNF